MRSVPYSRLDARPVARPTRAARHAPFSAVVWACVLALTALSAACGDDQSTDNDALDVVDLTDLGPPDADTEPACTSDDDCFGSWPYCDVASGECVNCRTYEDCTFSMPMCRATLCSPCEADAECATIDPGLFCDEQAGVCVNCLDDADCGADAPRCDVAYGFCVRCLSSFDCDDSGAPVCSEDELGIEVCVDSTICVDDDAREVPSDDGPAGATVLTFTGDPATALIDDGKICVGAEVEADWYAFDVAAGDAATITVGWSDAGVDLDVSAFLADGTLLGESWFGQPASIRLSYLPVGRVYVAVVRFDGAAPNAVAPYTVQVEVTPSSGCTGSADCAAEYDTQLYRGDCATDGACVPIDGAGAVADGDPCDSPEDCASGVCGYGASGVATQVVDVIAVYWAAYTANADSLGTCRARCTADTDCTGEVCTTLFGGTNHCVPACAIDEVCPVDLLIVPTSSDWSHTTCDAGHCT